MVERRNARPGQTPSSAIAGLRRRIDAVDAEIVALIAQRLALVDKLLPLKASIAAPCRERQVLRNAARLARKLKTDVGVVTGLFDRLVEQTLKYQRDKRKCRRN